MADTARRLSISLVVPFYNEEHAIADFEDRNVERAAA